MIRLRPKTCLLHACLLVACIVFTAAWAKTGETQSGGPSTQAAPALAHAVDSASDRPDQRVRDEVTEAHKRRRVGDALVTAAPRAAASPHGFAAIAAAARAPAAAPRIRPVRQDHDEPSRTLARIELRACRGRAPPVA